MRCSVCRMVDVDEDASLPICPSCVRRVVEEMPNASPADAVASAIVPIEHARELQLVKGVGRKLSDVETFLVRQARGEAVDGELNPIESPITEEQALQLAGEFEYYRNAPTIPRAKDDRQRRKIGEAVASMFFTAGLRGDEHDCDAAARRAVAALGVDDALAVADVMIRWGQALAAWADKAAERGMKR